MPLVIFPDLETLVAWWVSPEGAEVETEDYSLAVVDDSAVEAGNRDHHFEGTAAGRETAAASHV